MRLSVLGNHGIKINQASDSFGNGGGNTSNYHACVAMSDQHNVRQVLELQQPLHIFNVCFQRDAFGK
jgi:hypothetical protein